MIETSLRGSVDKLSLYAERRYSESVASAQKSPSLVTSCSMLGKEVGNARSWTRRRQPKRVPRHTLCVILPPSPTL